MTNKNEAIKTQTTNEENLPTTQNFFKKSCNSTKFLSKIFCRKKDNIEEEKKIRENLTEKQIDKMVKDSFPASDPPSTY